MEAPEQDNISDVAEGILEIINDEFKVFIDDEFKVFVERRYLSEIDRARYKEICKFYRNITEGIINKFGKQARLNRVFNFNDK